MKRNSTWLTSTSLPSTVSVMSGVSAISAGDGFSQEEALMLAARSVRDLKAGGILSFSEYNPTIDKFKSGTLLHDLLLEALFAMV